MAINTIKATIQMRRGAEQHFDPDQMTAGEWAVSMDSKKVWMCFAPGIVKRMATYEAFEQDMEEIRRILATCQDIQEAVEAFERLAEQHKNDAAQSAHDASASEAAAKLSEDNAAGSATSAAGSAQSAAGSAEDAKDSEDAAKLSEDNAAASAVAAEESKEAAAGSAQSAAGSAEDAKVSENAAEASADQAEDFSLMSKSYAVGTDGQVRPGDPTDNSKYYSDLAQYLTDEAAKLLDQAQKLISAATAGALIPAGTVAFENLPTEPQVGYMYNISNSFVTDGRFAEGPGIQYNSGANVYWTKDGQWDVMIGVQVTGVKGAAESYYRQGNVDITPANIGLGNVPNVSTNDQTPTFTQAATRENINSGEPNSTLWGKVRKWFADLKAVAFSGSYNDLSNKPSIPAAVRVKGNAESAYRTGDVNLTPANVGALPTTTGYAASDTPGGSANTLKGFKVTNGADIGYDTTDNAIGYTTGAPEGSGQSDGCMYRQAFSSAWAHNIWGDYRSGRIYTRGKNNGTWQPWNKILCAADIENSLNSNSTEKSLASAQGKALKGMIEQTNVNLNGFASGNGVRNSSGTMQVNTSPIRAHIFRGGISGTEKPWYKALEINVRHADNGDFEYVAYLLISWPSGAYNKDKMALAKLCVRRECGARLTILYATNLFNEADICIKTYDSYSKLELWIKTTVMYDAISVDVISYSCVDPGNFRAHGYG
ncbi:MAG: pyocin knob domain-containing protein, partial [Lachnospiraceae bacterium]|nr:pyocin knob domain-containing protein [Lachnospiraceae bacterium]